MLGWSPDIIHCHGWFTSLLPFYLKEGSNDDGEKLYFNHPVFKDTKIISSFHNDKFRGTLNRELVAKLKFDGFKDDCLDILSNPNLEALRQIASKFSDGIVLEENYKNANDSSYQDGVPVLNSEEYTEYYNFYQKFFSEELV
jgi:starch synthase